MFRWLASVIRSFGPALAGVGWALKTQRNLQFHAGATVLVVVFGLGLHIAYNLATQTLGGQLSVRNDPGQGAMFILRVPRQAPDLG